MDSRLRSVLLVGGLVALGYFLFFRKSEHPVPPDQRYATAPAAAERGNEQTVPIETGGLTATVSTYSGTLHNLRIVHPQFRDQRTGQAMNISTTRFEYATPLRTDIVFERDGRNVLPSYLTFRVESSARRRVELVATPDGSDIEVRRAIRGAADFSFIVRTTVINHGTPGRVRVGQSLFHWVARSEESGGFFRQSWQVTEGVCRAAGDGRIFRNNREDLRYWNDGVFRNAQFVALGNLYMLSALVPLGGDEAACHLRSQDGYRGDEATGSLVRGSLSWRPSVIERGASRDFLVLAYFGPKLGATLAAAAAPLREAVNLGFFAIIARLLLRLLQALYAFVHNWGVAIMLLTVIVRLTLFPLLARSTKTMAMMQKLKPELDVLNEKFKDNQEQKGLATMELYRKHKVNPLSGCLPQLAQLPIWWALYTTLQTSVELFHAPFTLWWRDLSAPDPYYVLPLTLGAVMFVQSKLMPPAMPDPMQQKMMLYFMPVFLTAISLFLPAGLALYMLTNSALAIVQQRITKAQIDKIVKAAPGDAIEVKPLPSTDSAQLGKGNPRSGADKKGVRRAGRK